MTPEKILIVDDDPDTRQMIAQVIAEHGYAFKTAEDGITALDIIKKSSFDIVIADDNIPLLSGRDLMSEVKRIHPETFFMILTEYSNDYSSLG